MLQVVSWQPYVHLTTWTSSAPAMPRRTDTSSVTRLLRHALSRAARHVSRCESPPRAWPSYQHSPDAKPSHTGHGRKSDILPSRKHRSARGHIVDGGAVRREAARDWNSSPAAAVSINYRPKRNRRCSSVVSSDMDARMWTCSTSSIRIATASRLFGHAMSNSN